MTATFAKKLFIAGLIALLFVPLNSFAQSSDLQNEVALKAAIAKDPKAERPKFDYSFFLYTKKRFSDSREQLKFLFALNSAHVGGRKLLKSLDEVEGLADIQYQDSQMRLFMIEKLKLDKEEEAAIAARNAVLTPERIAKVQADLDKRYAFSDRMKLETRPTDSEARFQDSFITATRNKQFTEAEKVMRNWITEFGKSPIAKADFGAFLIMRDRLVQAEALISDAMKADSDCLKLRIVSDLLKEIKSVKSSEKTADLKSRLNDELAVYQLSVNGQLEEAKRAPSGTSVTVTAKAPPTVPAPTTNPTPNDPSAKGPDGLPAVITAEDIQKMQIPEGAAKMQRRK